MNGSISLARLNRLRSTWIDQHPLTCCILFSPLFLVAGFIGQLALHWPYIQLGFHLAAIVSSFNFGLWTTIHHAFYVLFRWNEWDHISVIWNIFLLYEQLTHQSPIVFTSLIIDLVPIHSIAMFCIIVIEFLGYVVAFQFDKNNMKLK